VAAALPGVSAENSQQNVTLKKVHLDAQPVGKPAEPDTPCQC